MKDNNFIMKPKNDYIFKKIFGDENNKDILISLLQAVMNENVTDVQLLNNELNKDNISDKKSILDIRATINGGVQVDIEIQVSRTIYMPARSLYYWSKIYCEQLNIGDFYNRLKRTICINIVDFKATESKNYHSIYKLKEVQQNFELTNLMEIHFIEIPKINENNKNDALYQWMNFINASSREEMEKMAIVNKDIDKALEILNVMSQSKEERAAYLSREMALHDEATRINEAIQEGIEQGIEKGIEQGIEQGIEKGIEQEKEKVRLKEIQRVLKLLTKKIGCIDNQLRDNIEKLDSENLNLIIENILDIENIDDIKNVLSYKVQ